MVKLSVPCAQLLLVLEKQKQYHKPYAILSICSHTPYCQLKCFSAFEGMRTADIIRQEIEDLERLLQGNTARKKPSSEVSRLFDWHQTLNPILL